MLAPGKMAEVETGVLPQSTMQMNTTASGGTVRHMNAMARTVKSE